MDSARADHEGRYIVCIAGVVIVSPWMVHLVTDRFPLRYIHVPGAWARYQRMRKRIRRQATPEEANAVG